MVPMGRVQMICDFRNYNYWTGNAIGFRASHELCSNFLSCSRFSCLCEIFCLYVCLFLCLCLSVSLYVFLSVCVCVCVCRGWNELLGIFVGHVYFFLMFKYPQDFGGTQFISTPQILYDKHLLSLCSCLSLCLFVCHYFCISVMSGLIILQIAQMSSVHIIGFSQLLVCPSVL